jgi:hypothetical protein
MQRSPALAALRKFGAWRPYVLFIIRVCCIYGAEKLLYIGFDRSLRVLEVITVLKVNGEEIVIHAMKAT